MKNRMLCIGAALILSFVCLLLLGTVKADAESLLSGTCGVNVQWIFDESSGVLTISGSGAMVNYYNFQVVPWSQYGEKVTKIVVEDGVTSIGSYAFDPCTYVTSVSIADTVVEIYEYAFSGSRELVEIELPAALKLLGDYAFSGCGKLSVIHFNSHVPRMGCDVFRGVSAAASYPASYSSWSEENFQDFGGDITWYPDAGNGPQVSGTYSNLNREIFRWEIKDYTLYITRQPGNGEKYDYKLPQWCAYRGLVEKVVMSGEMTNMAKNFFAGFVKLKEIQWPTGLPNIGDYAFSGCIGLETLTLPDSVLYIGNEAFENCTNLKTLVLPPDLSLIELLSFENCTSLQSITIPANVEIIYFSAFKGCESLETIYFSGCKPRLQEVEKPEPGTTVNGAVWYNPGHPGTFSEIGHAVTVYYPENAQGWTAEALQDLNEQYKNDEVVFAPYYLESLGSQESEKAPSGTTGSQDKQQPNQTEQGVPETNLDVKEPEDSPTAEESQTLVNNESTEINPDSQLTIQNDPTNASMNEPTKEKNGAKWWIAVVIIAVLAVGAGGMIVWMKQKKNKE